MLMTAIAESRATLVPAPDPQSHGGQESTMIQTRFGPISADAERLVDIPGGLLGFPRHRKFVLAQIPDKRLERFMLLQSVEDPALSFIVLPLALETGSVDQEDIAEVCTTTGTRESDALIVLIVTVRKEQDGVKMTANLRAPVVVDTRRMIARQCVFSNNRYPIRQAL